MSTPEYDRINAAIRQTLGPKLIELLEDDSVIEIMRNANGILCVERLKKGIEETEISLSNEGAESLIKFLASQAKEFCNEKSPSLAVKLPQWHARFQGLLPPVVSSASFSIRKHSKHIFSLESYVERGELDQEQFASLMEAILNRENILISGGTGSGKTTLANAILQKMIETGDRIITVEDTSELRLDQGLGLQIFTKDSIGYDSQQALKDILRLRPDRIILGELRDKAALDLIKAWNTGHSGGLSTIHANSCELAIRRLESLIAEASVNVPKELISQTVNVIIQVKRQASKRFISSIKKLSGLNKDHNYNFCEIRGEYAKHQSDHGAWHRDNVVHLS